MCEPSDFAHVVWIGGSPCAGKSDWWPPDPVNGQRRAVEPAGDHWVVRGDHADYQVQAKRCTCPWETKHQGSRGPCKHDLAVGIVTATQ